MKVITLQNFESPDNTSDLSEARKYRVFLFWERRVSFTDRKQMLKFLVAASNELNYSIAEILQINKELFAIASDAFLLIESLKPEELLFVHNVPHSLYAAYNATGANAHAFIFKYIYDSLSELERVNKRLLKAMKARKQTLLAKQLNIMLNRIIAVRIRVDGIGTEV